jgi:hypothetical protein
MSAYGMPRAQTQAMNQSSPAMRGASALRYGILHAACCKLPLERDGSEVHRAYRP